MTDALALTPSQTVGPYLSLGVFGVITAELIDRADPEALHIRGQLLDGAGMPVPDGMIEIWQADAQGSYAEWNGFGRSGTVEDGWFEFVTVKPGPVPWPEGGMQAPHVAVGVFARGLLKRTVTRIYFPDEEDANRADPVLSRLEAPERESLVAAAEEGGYRFDIRLQGEGQTTFFAV